MKKILSTPDMSCNHCKMIIENAVNELTGIINVNADPNTKKVTVEFDDKTVTIDDIRSVIEDAGYDVDECFNHGQEVGSPATSDVAAINACQRTLIRTVPASESKILSARYCCMRSGITPHHIMPSKRRFERMLNK